MLLKTTNEILYSSVLVTTLQLLRRLFLAFSKLPICFSMNGKQKNALSISQQEKQGMSPELGARKQNNVIILLSHPVPLVTAQ